MNYFKVILATITILLLSSFHATAMGFLPPENLSETHEAEVAASDNISTEVDFTKCLADSAPGGVCYISGGISGDEVSQFKSHAKEYQLEIVFVQKADTESNDRIEEYIAGVQLQIKDAKGNLVVDMMTEGPFFLANLPPGKYQVSADHEGVIKHNMVNISAKKHQRIVFLWPR